MGTKWQWNKGKYCSSWCINDLEVLGSHLRLNTDALTTMH